MNRKFTCFASVVSEIQQSDIYLTVKARLLETPRANLNGVRVTAAFVDEIIDNEENYVGLPLCADVKNLANGDYQHLGHLYDARTGEFHSAQIGSFYHFEKEETTDGAALIGYARIMKRNKAVCHAISELFADGALKFSFEISCGSYEELDDGTIQIDADKNNFLEGAAVVSFPACENAVALDLVAECNLLADDTRKGENTMDENVVEVIASEDTAPEAEVQVAEEEQNAQTEINAEEVSDESSCKEVTEVAECSNKDGDEEVADCGKEDEKKETASENNDEVNAEVVVVERRVQVEDVSAYNTDDGSSVEEHIVHETTVTTPVPDEPYIAEASDTDIEEEEDDKEQEVETAASESTEVAQEETPDFMAMIAELKYTIDALRKEIAEIKETPAHVVAETISASTSGMMNPFIDNMSVEKKEKKYSLLDKDDGVTTYTLLDRA